MLLKSIRKRISAITLVFTLGTALAVTLAAGLLLRANVVSEEREYRQNRLLEYWAVYQTGGIDLLRRDIAISGISGEDRLYAIRLASPAGRTLLLSVPRRWNAAALGRALEVSPLEDQRVFRVPAGSGNPPLEGENLRLGDGNVLQFAISTSSRTRLLSRFWTGASLLSALIAAVAAAVSTVASRKIVNPIRRLSEDIRSIDPTNFGLHPLQVSNAGSEVEILVAGFNKMGSQIARLLEGFRRGIDDMAHDLRTPLTRLMQKMELAVSANPKADTNQNTEVLRSGLEELKNIERIISTASEITRAEQGLLAGRSEICDIGLLCEDLADFYQYASLDEGASFTFQPPRAKILCRAHPDSLRQAIANLLDNAIKYSDARTEIELSLEPEGEHAVIRISDRGVGIDPADLPHIWQRMYRADHSRSKPGSGLGLSLVKAVVLAHGGQVGAGPREGGGSVFWIRLPIITKM